MFSHLTGIRQTTLLLASIAHHCFLGWQTGKLDFMPTLGIGQPALDLATAFPQATPASIFPPSGELSCPPCANIMYGIKFLKPLLLLKLVSTLF